MLSKTNGSLLINDPDTPLLDSNFRISFIVPEIHLLEVSSIQLPLSPSEIEDALLILEEGVSISKVWFSLTL